MRKEQNLQNLNKSLLEDIQPFLGCTDISIVALGTALVSGAALGFIPQWVDSRSNPGQRPPREIEPEEVISVSLQMNEGLYKSSHSTAIPNARGHRGAVYSAALGLFCNPGKKLNLFSNLDQGHMVKMKKVAAEKKIKIETVHKPSHNLFLYCKLTLRGKQGIVTAESCLQNNYSRVVFLTRNGTSLFHLADNSLKSKDRGVILDIPYLLQSLQYLSEEVYQKLEETVRINTQAYEYGLKAAPGLGIGARLNAMMQKQVIGSDIANLAACKTAAAEDVRMAGENIPVMGITSSGSHGITASIPIIAAAQKVKKNRQMLLKSIALSFWVTQRIDVLIGRLSAPCGCVIKAGIGAAAGIAYYMGGTVSQVEQAINNFIISTVGVICDGAKSTCSVKLANSASNACHSALLALEGVTLSGETGGVVREKLQQNIKNMVLISRSMQNIDPVIVDILKGYEDEESD